MKPEEIEALDLHPGQRIEMILNTSIGPDKYPLPDNETYPKMVYYQRLSKSEQGTSFLEYHEEPHAILSVNGQLGLREAVEGRKMLPLINKIYHLERV